MYRWPKWFAIVGHYSVRSVFNDALEALHGTEHDRILSPLLGHYSPTSGIKIKNN